MALLCLAAAGMSQDPVAKEPGFRCLCTGKGVFGLRDLPESGDKWLDRRVRSERNFLEMLFGVKPRLRLFGPDAPRDVFVARDATGEPFVGFRASWLIEKCSQQEEHRTARVAYALAHQYAHVLQWKRGCKLPEMAREQLADMLAGWYLGKRNIATLKGEPPLNRGFSAALFKRPVPFLNERFEHGRPEERVYALELGFTLSREDKLSQRKAYQRGLYSFLPPKVGVAGAPVEAPVPEGGGRKVECTHHGPCKHKVPCKHPQPCVHKVNCSHLGPCVHRTPCWHKVECRHRSPCVHRVECRHKVDCVHTVPCVHREHPYDCAHECDYDQWGNRVQCMHRVRCTHFKHRFDFLHNFDYAHDWDFEHEYDTQHDSDFAHEFDTQHEGDPIHEFDFAHEWDPVHDHDLAHGFDLVHDYDIKPAKPG